MPDSQKMKIAQALIGPMPQVMWEPGLEMPAELKALKALSTVGAGYGAGQTGGMIAQALAQRGIPALQGLGEAGAIFPEGPLPAGISKADMLTDSERAYKLNEMNEQLYLHNNDFVNALKAKWGMLRHAGGAP